MLSAFRQIRPKRSFIQMLAWAGHRLLTYCAPEFSHKAAITALGWCKRALPKSAYDARIEIPTKLAGMHLPNPLGLAAGFDKDGACADMMLAFGLGFAEVGTVTPLPQQGNAKPRLFRLREDEALINRFGFNSHGADALEKQLQGFRKKSGYTDIIGVNIGANRNSDNPIDDYVSGLERFYAHASYIAINVSSPNTPGLRQLEHGDALSRLLDILAAKVERLSRRHENQTPIFIKLSPDMNRRALEQTAQILQRPPVDGVIMSNTTLSRTALNSRSHRSETGGLSGAPLFHRSTIMLARLYLLLEGKLPIIGVGGISSGADAIEKIAAGASALQLYTALVYRGPDLIYEILKDIQNHLIKSGHNRLDSLTGSRAAIWAERPIDEESQDNG